MRRILVTAAVAATVLAAVPATAASAATRTVESVVGTGTLVEHYGSPTAYLGAIGNQRGQLGAFTITYPDGTYLSGATSCLVVDGRTAYLTGRIVLSGGPRRETNGWQRGKYLMIGVRDNGTSAAEPDELNFSPGSAADPGCGPNGIADPNLHIVKGNYRVTDAD